MYSFIELLKKIREEANLTQKELAQELEVSSILIAMIESGQKKPSKKFIEILAKRMKVTPNSISPFIFESDEDYKNSSLYKIVNNFGKKLQDELIRKGGSNLKNGKKYYK